MSFSFSIFSCSGSKPYELFFGRSYHNQLVDSEIQSKPLTHQQLIKRWEMFHKLVYPSVLQKSKDEGAKEAQKFNESHRIGKPLVVGTKVMIRQVDKKAGDSQYA